jgi:hypothetical protein
VVGGVKCWSPSTTLGPILSHGGQGPRAQDCEGYLADVDRATEGQDGYPPTPIAAGGNLSPQIMCMNLVRSDLGA